MNKTDQLQEAQAQIEATISRKEIQNVIPKSQKASISCVKKFQTLNSYLRILKRTYK